MWIWKKYISDLLYDLLITLFNYIDNIFIFYAFIEDALGNTKNLLSHLDLWSRVSLIVQTGKVLTLHFPKENQALWVW